MSRPERSIYGARQSVYDSPSLLAAPHGYSSLMFDQVHVVSSFAPRSKPDTDSVWMIVIAVGNEYSIMDRKIQVFS